SPTVRPALAGVQTVGDPARPPDPGLAPAHLGPTRCSRYPLTRATGRTPCPIGHTAWGGAMPAQPVAAENLCTSCDLGVLVDQPTETIVPENPRMSRWRGGGTAPDGGAWPSERCGRCLL